MSEFPDVQFLKSVAQPGQFPPDSGWEVAVAGRSNAGKSSAINALLNRKGMARTSRTPGRTQLYNYFQLAPEQRLVDLPGYGHAAVNAATRESWGPLAEALRRRHSFGAMVLVVDVRRGVGDLDLAMLDWAGRQAALGTGAESVEGGTGRARRAGWLPVVLRAQGHGRGGCARCAARLDARGCLSHTAGSAAASHNRLVSANAMLRARVQTAREE
jgi:ribosome biogenesis GTP-binding protein YsxC/EngB